jgi:hypothetical protein
VSPVIGSGVDPSECNRTAGNGVALTAVRNEAHCPCIVETGPLEITPKSLTLVSAVHIGGRKHLPLPLRPPRAVAFESRKAVFGGHAPRVVEPAIDWTTLPTIGPVPVILVASIPK